jgi:hypothetical protein
VVANDLLHEQADISPALDPPALLVLNRTELRAALSFFHEHHR